MDKKLVRKWIRALRSGKFRQARGQLRKQRAGKFSYCCLGVGCHVVNPKNWTEDGEYRDIEGEDHARTHYGDMPWNVRRLLGVAWEDNGFLVHMNDTDKKNFATIADWIEKNILNRK